MDGANHVRRDELLVAADRVRIVKISSPKLALLANVRQQTAWSWLHGRGCDEESERRLLQALGLERVEADET